MRFSFYRGPRLRAARLALRDLRGTNAWLNMSAIGDCTQSIIHFFPHTHVSSPCTMPAMPFANCLKPEHFEAVHCTLEQETVFGRHTISKIVHFCRAAGPCRILRCARVSCPISFVSLSHAGTALLIAFLIILLSLGPRPCHSRSPYSQKQKQAEKTVLNFGRREAFSGFASPP